MWLAVLLFCIGLLCLIKGGDWFVDGATGIAQRFHVPELLIGATVVSIGTTLPEVMVSATSALQGSPSIAYGNAIGSIICNTALISGLTVAIAPSIVEKKPLRMPVLFFFGSAFLYAGLAYVNRCFSRINGIIFLLIFCVYMTLLIRQAIIQGKQTQASKAAAADTEEHKPSPLWKDILFLIIGAVLIAVGARLLVDNGIIIAQELGVPETVIAVTFVALGTSLPELVTAIVSLAKGHGALSLGNIIGANLFNLVLVSGAAITLRPFEVPNEKELAGMNASLVVDIPLMLLVMAILTLPALFCGKLKRYQGILLLALYAGYCVFQFV
ncbi:MAG: calcium/sodium antiporter [Lachnospiraceae bacterium]|nr:calcium/sodium antiporter [Lachnospiraceae bacterium]